MKYGFFCYLSGIIVVCGVFSVALAQGDFDGTVRVGGSTTLLPVIADCASQFMEKYPTWDKVDPSLPKKQTLLFVTGGGSGFGVNAVLNGTVAVGMSSRAIKPEEKEKLGDHKEFLVSKDCVAFVVRKDNPLAKLDNLSSEDVAKIYTGEAKTFKDVRADLPAKPIVVLMRDMAGGSTDMVQTLILKKKTFTPQAIEVPSQGANLKKVEENASAITFISSVIAYQNDNLKVLKFEGVEPTGENVLSGKYLVTRPLLLIVKGVPSTAVQKFIDFILHDGQSIVSEHGYVPVASK